MPELRDVIKKMLVFFLTVVISFWFKALLERLEKPIILVAIRYEDVFHICTVYCNHAKQTNMVRKTSGHYPVSRSFFMVFNFRRVAIDSKDQQSREKKPLLKQFPC